MRLFGTIVSTLVLLLMPIASAGADPTGGVRVLECGEAGLLTVVLTPNAFSSSVPAFHDVSSNAVLTPLNVRVTSVNGQFILRSTPGVVGSDANVVSCSYTDPAGLFVEITGVLSGR